MSIETALYTALTANSGVTTLVSTRIYPNVAPESATLPYIVYSRVTTEHFSTLVGSGDAERARIQMQCAGTTYASAKAVAAAVVAALQGNGYQQSEYDLYDDTTELHSIFVDWSLMD